MRGKKKSKKNCKPLSDLRLEIERLKLKLNEMHAVEMAKGLLADKKGISEEEAHEILLALGEQQGKSVLEVAETFMVGSRLFNQLPLRKKKK